MRLAVLTLFTPEVADVGEISVANKAPYCARWGYDFHVVRESLDPRRPAPWSKILLIEQHLPNYDWIFWTDHDSLILRYDQDLARFCDPDVDMVVTLDEAPSINTGQFFLKNNERSFRFLRESWEQKQFLMHIWREQMAMMHLLTNKLTDLKAKYLHQSTFNSYPHLYQPGEFLIHFAGAGDKLALMKHWAQRVNQPNDKPLNSPGPPPASTPPISAMRGQAPARKSAIAAAPELAVGLEAHRAGDLASAQAAYKKVLEQDPENLDALHLLGVSSHQRGEQDVAVQLIRKAIAGAGGDAAPAHYHNNLGEALRAQSRLWEAAEAYRRALAQRPDYAEAHHNLGCAMHKLWVREEAHEHYRAALALRPDYVEALNNLGIILTDYTRYDEAMACYQRVIELQPDYVPAYNNISTLLMRSGDYAQAEAVLRRALALRPNFAEAHSNLAVALRSQGRVIDSLVHTRKALESAPESAEAHFELGLSLLDLGCVEEAIASFQTALMRRADYTTAHDALLLSLNYQESYDADAVFAEHVRFGRTHGGPLESRIRPHENARDPERRLRVGYLSYDMRQHSVDRFFTPILAAHDKEQFEIFCYSHVQRPDESTSEIRRHTDQWREITGKTDEQVVQQIRDDRIDIMVDLEGHTVGGRLCIFARKPAPVQVSYIGYPNTTGLSTIDYRLTDALVDPPGEIDRYFTEELVRLPGCFLCYQPPDPAPDVGPLPAMSSFQVRFGCFNILAKQRPTILRLWARILEEVPGSILMIKTERGLDDDLARDQWLRILEENGISGERVELYGRTPSYRVHLGFYGNVDIILDPFPYNGTTTTCEALWMGVPVVTLAGKTTHVSRVGLSLLTNAGMSEWIARTPEEYVRIARDLAGDLERLAQTRRTMRERLRNSALLDRMGRAKDVEAAYRWMWRKWCDQPPA